MSGPGFEAPWGGLTLNRGYARNLVLENTAASLVNIFPGGELNQLALAGARTSRSRGAEITGRLEASGFCFGTSCGSTEAISRRISAHGRSSRKAEAMDTLSPDERSP